MLFTVRFQVAVVSRQSKIKLGLMADGIILIWAGNMAQSVLPIEIKEKSPNCITFFETFDKIQHSWLKIIRLITS